LRLEMAADVKKIVGEFKISYRRVDHLDLVDRKLPLELQFGDAEV